MCLVNALSCKPRVTAGGGAIQRPTLPLVRRRSSRNESIAKNVDVLHAGLSGVPSSSAALSRVCHHGHELHAADL